MLNICFSETECAIIKTGLGEPTQYSHPYLSYGGISPAELDKGCKERLELFVGGSWLRRARWLWQSRRRVRSLLRAARREGEVRIWYSNNPDALCGLYHTVHALQGEACRIFAVRKPAHIGFRAFEDSFAEADPEDIPACLCEARELSAAEREQLAHTWDRLVEENAPLRVIEGGEVIGVPVDYLDEEVLSFAPTEGSFRLEQLIGNVLGKSHRSLHFYFVEQRIFALLRKGQLTVVTPCAEGEDVDMTVLQRATPKP